MSSKSESENTASSGREKKPRLGRGLATLIGDKSIAAAISDSPDSGNSVFLRESESIKKIPIEFVSANNRNPRKKFSKEELADLAASIKVKGIFQPILVRPRAGKEDHYEIIAGERRWRAAQVAKLHEIPAVIRDVNDQEALELALIENIQRTDLNPLEEALGYEMLISNYSISQEKLGNAIGKSRSHIANTMRLLRLPESVRDLLMQGKLTAGHARALVTTKDPENLAKKIVSQGLNVREAEQLANESSDEAESNPKKKGSLQKDSDTIALEKRLSDGLGLNVAISSNRNGKGEMRIKFKSLEQLDEICRILGQPA